jgi:hypothetical protein
MSEVAIFTDYKLDESYTPVKISIRVGNTFSDLREVGAAVNIPRLYRFLVAVVEWGEVCVGNGQHT